MPTKTLKQIHEALGQIEKDRAKERKRLEAERKLQQQEQDLINSATPVKLPIFPAAHQGLIPTAINMSRMFIPLGRGARGYLKNLEIVTWDRCRVFYSGPELDEPERDVFMALMKIGNEQAFGEFFTFSYIKLLKLCHPNIKKFSQGDYLWLRDSLTRFQNCTLRFEKTQMTGEIEEIGRWKNVQIITDLSGDMSSGIFTCRLDPRLARLFENSQFCLIDLTKRALLKLKLSRSLQAIIACSKDKVLDYKLSWLIERHDYHLPEYKVKNKFKKACAELILAEIIGRFEWIKNRYGEEYLRVHKKISMQPRNSLDKSSTFKTFVGASTNKSNNTGRHR